MPSLFGPISPPADGTIRVKQVSGLPAIMTALRGLDQALPPRDSFPFAQQGYLSAVFQAYHDTDDPHLLLAYRGDRLVGLFPLISRPMVRLGLRVREYGFPFNPNTIVNDCLFDGDGDSDVARALLERAYGLGAQSLILDHLPGTDDGQAAACLTAANQGLLAPTDRPTPARALYYAQLDGDYDRFMATRSRNHRWQIKKTWRKAQDAGALKVTAHCGADEIRAHLNDWFAVEGHSWQGQSPSSAMSTADRTFHTLLLDSLPADQVGRLWMVYLDGTPIAALRMIDGVGTLGRKTCVHTMHFDAAHRKIGPGLLAFDAMVQDACARGLAEIDMHGTTEFFARWSTGTRAHSSLRLYRPGLRGTALQQARRLNRRLEQRAADKANKDQADTRTRGAAKSLSGSAA
ncbi:MAG: GNAT family N-acetyltransferase [Pelagimonas sp.]|jgi:CelD/BcsL family acetyltransferase involved in cellulose biosynthesis|nr:GNAT family N-acetyltransferase [Pelagimonas sp.]